MVEIQKMISLKHSSRGGKQIQWIVIHYTGNRTDKAVNNAKFVINGSAKASAHFFVDPDSIYQSVEESRAAWAVGKQYGNGGAYRYKVNNANSVSIELCSNGGQIAEKTMHNAVELTHYLMAKYNIPADHVVRHWDVCAKRCPGWDGWLPGNETLWYHFLEMVKGNTTTTTTQSTQKPVNTTPTTQAKSLLTVDGSMGYATIKATQKYLGTTQDGIISGQIKSDHDKYFPGIVCQYGKGGSNMVRALQRYLGVTADGYLGKNTIRAWQKRVGTPADGVASSGGMLIKAWQKFLNQQ